MTNNGLSKFSFHIEDAPSLGIQNFQIKSTNNSIIKEDAETIARKYINLAFGSDRLEGFNQPDIENGSQMTFRLKNMEEEPLTGNKLLKFSQEINSISVYGSQINVELNEVNSFVSFSSNLSLSKTFNSLAKISPEEAKLIAIKELGLSDLPKARIPLLYYYFQKKTSQSLLVYVFKDLLVPVREDSDTNIGNHHFPQVIDLIIDAENGQIIDQLPRVACSHTESKGVDEVGDTREFGVTKDQNGGLVMINNQLNVKTYNFGFQSIIFNSSVLPGKVLENPPAWFPSGVSAHANACEVASFLRNVLKRNGVDGKGKPYISSINCIQWPDNREWKNAAWFNGQMIYGQKAVDGGSYRSYASALDIVAHEVIHGLTEVTSRLEYRGESGALNESYSDIFGIIISNWQQKNIGLWDWKLGEDLSLRHLPIRDLSDPVKHNQPDHMDNYLKLPLDPGNDLGGVHINSGIHNKAAYNLATSLNQTGAYLFTKEEVAYLFYLSLIKLSPLDGFVDSLNALLLSAKSLFKPTDPKKSLKIEAISKAFQKTGIKII